MHRFRAITTGSDHRIRGDLAVHPKIRAQAMIFRYPTGKRFSLVFRNVDQFYLSEYDTVVGLLSEPYRTFSRETPKRRCRFVDANRRQKKLCRLKNNKNRITYNTTDGHGRRKTQHALHACCTFSAIRRRFAKSTE